MKQIPVGKDKVALVDDADYEHLSKFKWYFNPCNTVNGGYSYAYIGGIGYKKEAMHRMIMKAVKGQIIDHKNGNGLDNRRENLRLANKSLNSANCFKTNISSTGYRGVNKRYHRWRAQIQINGKRTFLGSFPSPEQAAKVYDKAAIAHFGKFATINFPLTDTDAAVADA